MGGPLGGSDFLKTCQVAVLGHAVLTNELKNHQDGHGTDPHHVVDLQHLMPRTRFPLE